MRSSTRPETLELTDRQYATAARYQHLVSSNSTKTINNINQQISDWDSEVGKFLGKHNVFYDRNNLKAHLQNAMADVTDVTVPEARLNKEKARLVTQFVDSLGKNDLSTLWKSRKSYDQLIAKAFEGSPSASKEAKRALRDGVQEFIGQYTPHGRYKNYMSEMSDLYNLRDLVKLKDISTRGTTGIGKVYKAAKPYIKAAGAAAAGVGIYQGGSYLFGHSRSDAG